MEMNPYPAHDVTYHPAPLAWMDPETWNDPIHMFNCRRCGWYHSNPAEHPAPIPVPTWPRTEAMERRIAAAQAIHDMRS